MSRFLRNTLWGDVPLQTVECGLRAPSRPGHCEAEGLAWEQRRLQAGVEETRGGTRGQEQEGTCTPLPPASVQIDLRAKASRVPPSPQLMQDPREAVASHSAWALWPHRQNTLLAGGGRDHLRRKMHPNSDVIWQMPTTIFSSHPGLLSRG